MSVTTTIVSNHIDSFWPDRQKELFSWRLGPIEEALPGFLVCRVKPAKSADAWVYVSVGASKVKLAKSYTLEFMLEAPDDNARYIETLAMVAHYHATGKTLDLGHILNGGRPWLNDSKCDRFLLSLPYPFGPNFEWLRSNTDGDIRFLWLLPITSEEANYAKTHGVEPLEQLFDRYRIQAIDPSRQSVV